jgi:hypothetical protein
MTRIAKIWDINLQEPAGWEEGRVNVEKVADLCNVLNIICGHLKLLMLAELIAPQACGIKTEE